MQNLFILYQDKLEKIVDSIKTQTETNDLSQELKSELEEVGLHGLFFLSLLKKMDDMNDSQKTSFFNDIEPEIENYINLCEQINLP